MADAAAAQERRLIEQVRAEFAEEDVSCRIKQIRERLRMSAEDFGQLLGIGKSAIWNYESGKCPPRKSVLDRLDLLELGLNHKEGGA